jgi:hypothetical protein
MTKMHKLEDEADKLRKEIAEKETKKRKALREWDRLQRESELAGLRTRLADESLRKLEGDGIEGGSGAAF